MNPAGFMLARLLSRGDKVSIDNGQLRIESRSGKDVPANFLKDYSEAITVDILSTLGITGYRFLKHSTGYYGEYKAGGVTLQFTDLLTGENPYACFNAKLKRQRNSATGEKGKPLPKRQFSVSKRSNFYKFWLATGLPTPESLTRFHTCMGKLKLLVFTAELTSQDKFNNQSLRPLKVTYE